ncbi:MAG: hypothetical protein AAB299_09205, partial [Thermodesulfobacteriota bacterium]
MQVATNVSAVAAGSRHSLFIKSDSTLWVMGYNGYGQLGNGTTIDRASPAQVATGVSAAAAGANHSLFLKQDGTLWAMGLNGFGQLGDGTTTNSSAPVQVNGLSGVIAVGAGTCLSFALNSDGTVWAWGWNGYGQLGDGTTKDRNTPVQVSSLNLGSTTITTPTPTPSPSPSPTSSPTPVPTSTIIFSNNNLSGVSNNPTVPTTFSITQPYVITSILTYHWNSGQGKTAGTIGLHSNSKTYGPWQATGYNDATWDTSDTGGDPQLYWVVKPNVTINAGSYTVDDSDTSSWSHNSTSGYQGIVVVKGYLATSTTTTPTPSPTPSTSNTVTVFGSVVDEDD